MRMRKKRNLDQRLAACRTVNLGYIPDNFEHKNLPDGTFTAKKIIFEEIFGNKNPVRVEIGCGKGSFIQQLAEREPEVNFIAVEMAVNVLVTAMERTVELNRTPNLRYLMGKADYLAKIVDDNCIEAIYLNFSCPYPKTAYAKHRLTDKRFIDMYEKILIPGGKIYQKTDNIGLFDYSLEQFSKCGWCIENMTRDLHNSGISGNIVTEYEQKFLEQGLPICYLEAVSPKS